MPNCRNSIVTFEMLTLKHANYSVGIICALKTELVAVMAMLDERHSPLAQHPSDFNAYTLGRMGTHNVIIACLPSGKVGTNRAAVATAQLNYSYPSIRFFVLVGVAGGIPSPNHDTRLGDVVVSQPRSKHGGVVQYDLGRTVEQGRFVRTGSLNNPPMFVLTALNKIQAEDQLNSHHSLRHLEIPQNLQPMYNYPGADHDLLFEAEYNHVQDDGGTCRNCNVMRLVPQQTREDTRPRVHYGTIGSANRVIADGRTRDELGTEHGLMCIEMEAAGLIDDFPSVVIRGISDYADSHKNKKWQPYAAMAAAAYAKAFLDVIPPLQRVDISMSAPLSPADFRSSSDRDRHAATSASTSTSNAKPGNSFLVLKPVSSTSVGLGRFVISPRAPWEAFCPFSPKPAENDIGILAQPRLHELIQSVEHASVRETFMNLLSINGELDELFDVIASASEKTYILPNSGDWFRNACGEKETRTWLEEMVKNRLPVYMVVGIHTIYVPPSRQRTSTYMNAIESRAEAMDMDQGHLPSGELIVAVEYRKVLFHWLWSRDVDRAILETGKNLWQLSVIVRNDTDEDEIEPGMEIFPDILEVTLQDHVVREDLDSDEITTIRSQFIIV